MLRMKVKGMMCEHCEKRVKNALEELEEIEAATANYKDGTVKIRCALKVSEKKLKETIKASGYQVRKIEQNEWLQ